MDEAEFLRAIVTRPADDTVRLVYADWLDERGESDRAAFIRVQIELARLPKGDPRRVELGRRELDLFEAARDGWRRREYPTRPGGGYPVDYCRGFAHRLYVESAPVHFEMFLAGAPEAFARAPVEELWLAPVMELDWNSNRQYGRGFDTPQIERLARVPELARLALVRVESPTHDLDGIARALIANPHLRAVPRLHFSNRYLTVDSPNGWTEADMYIEETFNPATEGALVFAFGHRVSWVA
jgi:uncharacterized protein (TIGR02996 family)